MKKLFLLCTLVLLSAIGMSKASGEVDTQNKIVDLVDMAKFDPTIVLDIRYATENNFTGKIVYPSARCFLVREAAEAVCRVQKKLRAMGLGLKIFDGYRPLSVQKIFWKICPHEGYVANPAKGSKHNRGAAVDLTLINLSTGLELHMPSDFDDLTNHANRNYEKMDPVAQRNCLLLENMMAAEGFLPLKTEWWHFDFHTWQNYPILDISFDELDSLRWCL